MDKTEEKQIEDLMELNCLKYKEFNFGYYTGQSKALRELAIEKFGVEKVAKMSDSLLEKEFIKNGLIPMQISFDKDCDGETIYLVPIRILDKFDTLCR